MDSANNMTRKLSRLSRSYQAALREYLKQRPAGEPAASAWVGTQGHGPRAGDTGPGRDSRAGVDCPRAAERLSRHADAMVRRAGNFFAEAITPIEKTHRTAREANAHFGQLNEALRQRSADSGRLEPTVETGNPPAQGRGGIPSQKRKTLWPVARAVAANAGTVAASDPPTPVGAGGRTQEDQPRVA